jgi:hypothetical protein
VEIVYWKEARKEGRKKEKKGEKGQRITKKQKLPQTKNSLSSAWSWSKYWMVTFWLCTADVAKKVSMDKYEWLYVVDSFQMFMSVFSFASHSVLQCLLGCFHTD